jgi:hypothetical protein
MYVLYAYTYTYTTICSVTVATVLESDTRRICSIYLQHYLFSSSSNCTREQYRVSRHVLLLYSNHSDCVRCHHTTRIELTISLVVILLKIAEQLGRVCIRLLYACACAYCLCTYTTIVPLAACATEHCSCAHTRAVYCAAQCSFTLFVSIYTVTLCVCMLLIQTGEVV